MRRNYFRFISLYVFNIARISLSAGGYVFRPFLLFPSIVASTITLGLMTQITNALPGARGSFPVPDQLVDNVGGTDVHLRSAQFERELDGNSLQEAIPTLR